MKVSRFSFLSVSVFFFLFSNNVFAQNYGSWTPTQSTVVGIQMNPNPEYGLSVGPGGGNEWGVASGIYAQGAVGIKAVSDLSNSWSPFGAAPAVWGIANHSVGIGGRFEGKKYAGQFKGKVLIEGSTDAGEGMLSIQNAGSIAADILGDFLVEGNGEINGVLEVNILHATENLYSKEVHVKLPPFPDYVFEKE